jgi:APA family basic amino acid/polyamine antiporter
MIASRRGRSRELQRILGITFGVAISLGAAIGSGILRTPSMIAADIPNGAFIVGLWVIGGLHAALGVNIYAELGTAVPKAGGSYVYARRAFGDSAGLLVGWADWLTTIATVAAASVSFAEFLAIPLPSIAPNKIAVAITLQAIIYGTNILGLRQGRIFQETTSLIKAGMLLLFVVISIAVAWVAPPGASVALSPAASPVIGFTALLTAYQMILGAYSGWSAPTTFSEENKDPARHIPKALVLGLLTIAALYIGINAALVMVLGPQSLAGSSLPFTLVLDRIGGPIPGMVFAVGALIVVASCANAVVMSGSRILFALSRDGLMPPAFRLLNKGGSPDIALLMAAAASFALAATGSFGVVFGLIGIFGTLIEIIVGAALFKLRRSEPALERPFRAWLYPWLPAFLLVIDTSLLVLFARSDRTGVLFAFALAAFCVPFAIVTRRAKLWGHPADA